MWGWLPCRISARHRGTSASELLSWMKMPENCAGRESRFGSRNSLSKSCKSCFGAAKAAAQKAVQMDPTLAEAHSSLAWAIMHYDWDCITAEKEFQHALELNPNYMSVQHFDAACLAAMGHWEKSIAQITRTLHLDHLSRSA